MVYKEKMKIIKCFVVFAVILLLTACSGKNSESEDLSSELKSVSSEVVYNLYDSYRRDYPSPKGQFIKTTDDYSDCKLILTTDKIITKIRGDVSEEIEASILGDDTFYTINNKTYAFSEDKNMLEVESIFGNDLQIFIKENETFVNSSLGPVSYSLNDLTGIVLKKNINYDYFEYFNLNFTSDFNMSFNYKTTSKVTGTGTYEKFVNNVIALVNGEYFKIDLSKENPYLMIIGSYDTSTNYKITFKLEDKEEVSFDFDFSYSQSLNKELNDKYNSIFKGKLINLDESIFNDYSYKSSYTVFEDYSRHIDKDSSVFYDIDGVNLKEEGDFLISNGWLEQPITINLFQNLTSEYKYYKNDDTYYVKVLGDTINKTQSMSEFYRYCSQNDIGASKYMYLKVNFLEDSLKINFLNYKGVNFYEQVYSINKEEPINVRDKKQSFAANMYNAVIPVKFGTEYVVDYDGVEFSDYNYIKLDMKKGFFSFNISEDSGVSILDENGKELSDYPSYKSYNDNFFSMYIEKDKVLFLRLHFNDVYDHKVYNYTYTVNYCIDQAEKEIPFVIGTKTINVENKIIGNAITYTADKDVIFNVKYVSLNEDPVYVEVIDTLISSIFSDFSYNCNLKAGESVKIVFHTSGVLSLSYVYDDENISSEENPLNLLLYLESTFTVGQNLPFDYFYFDLEDGAYTITSNSDIYIRIYDMDGNEVVDSTLTKKGRYKVVVYSVETETTYKLVLTKV